MNTLLLSPHLDDAALSAGQFLANQPGCDVLTVFAAVPDMRDTATPYDLKCGFKTSEEAMKARQLEDRDAMAWLKANPIYGDYLDGQYGATYGVDDLVTDIIHMAKAYDVILGPLGIAHPDHILLSDALICASEYITADIYLWEDLPNRVLFPEQVHERLSQLPPTSLEVPGGAGPLADKMRALMCYRSQLGTGDLDFNVLLVPERFWKLTKGGE